MDGGKKRCQDGAGGQNVLIWISGCAAGLGNEPRHKLGAAGQLGAVCPGLFWGHLTTFWRQGGATEELRH